MKYYNLINLFQVLKIMIKSSSEKMDKTKAKKQEKYKEITKYEHGAHFKYSDLQRKLLDLVETIPLDRLGINGIYFQEDDNEEQDKPSISYKSEPNIRNGLSILKLKSLKPTMYTPKKTIQFLKKDKMKIYFKQGKTNVIKEDNGNGTLPLFHYNNTEIIDKSQFKDSTKLPDLKKQSPMLHFNIISNTQRRFDHKNSTNIHLPLLRQSQANHVKNILIRNNKDNKSIGKNGYIHMISKNNKIMLSL